MTLAAAIDACLAGLWTVFAWPELAFLALGVVVGAVVGILPGLGGSATLAMLLPFTLTLDPVAACAVLIGVAGVTATTGDLTSILVGIPGEPIAAATVIDGHAMALRGEAGRAIGASLVSSLIGSVLGALTLGVLIPLVLPLARAIGSPELFMLAMLGITFIAPLSGASRLKGLAVGSFGLLLSTVGLDPITSIPRFTFGRMELWDGVGLIPAALGIFAVPEIVALGTLASSARPASPENGRLVDGMRDAVRRWALVAQSSAIGTGIGLLPGVGASVSQWVAYGHALRRAEDRAAFGRGAIEGVIAPSAANNATLGGSLVPALALGIPGGLLSAMLVTALTMKGIIPGPAMIVPDAQGGHLTLIFSLVWLLVAANVLAVALACLATGSLVRIATAPSWRIVPVLVVLTFVGAFAERQLMTDLVIMIVFGALGLALAHYDWPRPPLLLGLVLGPLAENRLFLSVQAYGAGWLVRPGVLVIGAIIVASLFSPYGAGRIQAKNYRRDTSPAARPGELIVGLILVVLALAAFVIARSYSDAVRLVPQIASAGLCLCLALAWTLGRAGTPSVNATHGVSGTAAWFPVFLLLIWILGFSVGAPVAIFAHLLIASRRRPFEALLLSLATGLALHLLLMRVADMTPPPGLLSAWWTAER